MFDVHYLHIQMRKYFHLTDDFLIGYDVVPGWVPIVVGVNVFGSKTNNFLHLNFSRAKILWRVGLKIFNR